MSNFIHQTCPRCNGQVFVPEGRELDTCPWCGHAYNEGQGRTEEEQLATYTSAAIVGGLFVAAIVGVAIGFLVKYLW